MKVVYDREHSRGYSAPNLLFYLQIKVNSFQNTFVAVIKKSYTPFKKPKILGCTIVQCHIILILKKEHIPNLVLCKFPAYRSVSRQNERLANASNFATFSDLSNMYV